MSKITSILFPVDFKPASYNAVDFVIDLSKKTGAFVTIYHADEAPAMAEINTRPLIIENQQKITTERFKEMEEKFPELQTIPHRFDSSQGSFEQGIEYFLNNNNVRIDLIIMGTEGARGLKEVFGGTHTFDVIDKTSVSVLVIPEKAPFIKLKKIVFAYDYSGITNPGSLNALKSLVSAYHAQISVLNIAQDQERNDTADLASTEIISKEFPEAEYVTRKGEDVEKEIENYVMLNSIDMIAVLQRPHNYFEKLFTETTTEKLAYHTVTPLLVLR